LHAAYMTAMAEVGPRCSMKFRHEAGRLTGDAVASPGPGQYSLTSCDRPRSAAFTFGCSRPQSTAQTLRCMLHVLLMLVCWCCEASLVLQSWPRHCIMAVTGAWLLHACVSSHTAMQHDSCVYLEGTCLQSTGIANFWIIAASPCDTECWLACKHHHQHHA